MSCLYFVITLNESFLKETLGEHLQKKSVTRLLCRRTRTVQKEWKAVTIRPWPEKILGKLSLCWKHLPWVSSEERLEADRRLPWTTNTERTSPSYNAQLALTGDGKEWQGKGWEGGGRRLNLKVLKGFDLILKDMRKGQKSKEAGRPRKVQAAAWWVWAEDALVGWGGMAMKPPN